MFSRNKYLTVVLLFGLITFLVSCIPGITTDYYEYLLISITCDTEEIDDEPTKKEYKCRVDGEQGDYESIVGIFNRYGIDGYDVIHIEIKNDSGIELGKTVVVLLQRNFQLTENIPMQP